MPERDYSGLEYLDEEPETRWDDRDDEEELTVPHDPSGPQDVSVFDDEQPVMLAEEAFKILERITSVQNAIVTAETNGKAIVAQKRADLKKYLGNFERLTRLLNWYAKNLPRNRRTITTYSGTIGQETVQAQLRVADKALAIEWCKANCPQALVTSIDGDKLPKPEKKAGEHGLSEWVAPEGSGLIAIPEREEIVINGKYLRTLLEGRGKKKEGEDESSSQNAEQS